MQCFTQGGFRQFLLVLTSLLCGFGFKFHQHAAVRQLHEGTRTIPCLHTGDVNGDSTVSAEDAQLAFIMVLGLITPSETQLCTADCNGDGVVSATDAQLIFSAALGFNACVDPLLPPTPSNWTPPPEPSPSEIPPSPCPATPTPYGTPSSTATFSPPTYSPQPTAPASLTPSPGAVIEGVVQDAAGLPLDAITVTVYNSSWFPVAASPTDSAGFYRFELADLGSYYIHYDGRTLGETGYEALYYPGIDQQSLAELIHIAEFITVTIPPIVLQRTGAIAGRIINDAISLVGVANAFVAVMTQSFGPPTMHTLSMKSEASEWTSGSSAQRVGEIWTVAGSTFTDSDGYFRIIGIPPGDAYYVFADDEETNLSRRWYDGKANISELTLNDRVAILSGITTGPITIALQRTGAVTGVVAAGNVPVAGVSVRAYILNGAEPIWTGKSAESQPVLNAQGNNYEMKGLLPGSYLVRAVGSFVGYSSEFYQGANQVENATVVTVQAEATTQDVNFVIAATGSISGQIITLDSETGVLRVFLWYDPEHQAVAHSQDVHLHDRGLFRLERIEEGDYYFGAYLDTGLGYGAAEPFDPWTTFCAGSYDGIVTVTGGAETSDIVVVLDSPEARSDSQTVPGAGGETSRTNDFIAPVVTLNSVYSLTNRCYGKVTGCVSEDALVEVSIAGKIRRTYTSSDGTYSFDLSVPLALNAESTATVVAVDAAWNFSESVAVTFVHDSIPPQPPSDFGVRALSSLGQFRVEGGVGATEPLVQLELQVFDGGEGRSSPPVIVQAEADGSFQVDLPLEFGQQILVTAIDAAGNRSAGMPIAAGSEVDRPATSVWIGVIDNETLVHEDSYECQYAVSFPPYYEFRQVWGWSHADALVAGKQVIKLCGYEGWPSYTGWTTGSNTLLDSSGLDSFQYLYSHQYPIPPIEELDFNSTYYQELTETTAGPMTGVFLDNASLLVPDFDAGLNIARSCYPLDDCLWEHENHLHPLYLTALPPNGPFAPIFSDGDARWFKLELIDYATEDYPDCPSRIAGQRKTSKVNVGDGHEITVKVLRPKGSKTARKNPTASFLTDGPYRFDFQWVQEGTPGYYHNPLEAKTIPDKVLTAHAPEITYHWEVSAGRFEPDDGGNPLLIVGERTPGYRAGEAAEAVTLSYYIEAADRLGEQTRVLEVFVDHLARDFANFGVNKTCENVWWITAYNSSIPIANTWNCHGSVHHAHNGTGGGYQIVPPSISLEIRYPNPDALDWEAIETTLSRGDIVVFYSMDSSVPPNFYAEHSHICRGNYLQMYGANNEPSFSISPDGYPVGTWRWFECSSRRYYDAINHVFPNYIKEVGVQKKPLVKDW